MFLMAELICVVFHETHDKAPQGHIPFFWTLLHTVHLVVRAQQLIFLFTFVSQATTAPTALMCARWTPASTSRDAPGSRASLAVTRVTVPATTSANTARKSKCFPHICKTVNVLYVLIVALPGWYCCIALQVNWSCVMSTGPICRVPEAGGGTRPAAPVTVTPTRASTPTATRRAESVGARWACGDPQLSFITLIQYHFDNQRQFDSWQVKTGIYTQRGKRSTMLGWTN